MRLFRAVRIDASADERGGAEVVAEVFGGVLLALPVHAGSLSVVDLHAVHAYVALSRFGVPGYDAGEGDEGASVLGPGG